MDERIELHRWYRKLPAFLNDGAVMALAVEDGVVTYNVYGVEDTFTMGVEAFVRDVVEAEPEEYRGGGA